MAPSTKIPNNYAHAFLIFALLLLSVGMIFGLTGGLQYIIPGLLKEHLSFEKIRPLHVSSVVFWIILAAVGSVLTYLQEHIGKKIRYPFLVKLQFYIFLIAVIAILISYCMGIFGGREYWEFHPLLALPIVIGWLLFIINYFASAGGIKNQPVYWWMWMTGITFFLFTFLESYLWVFPYFRNNVVNDMTIQWKSYGSMVGSWNMLIYGCSIYLMDKISGTKKYSYSGISFALYFTGLFNLMFNWGHHVYVLPTHEYVKTIGYAVSMTEIILLGRIIYLWKSSLSTAKKYFYQIIYRFLVAADVWIFLTLVLAIAMSIPGINVYTHGTHITVGHTMGATIGINTMLLLAFSFDILGKTCRSLDPYKKMISYGYWTVNISLFIFWLSLIIAGVIKARWQMSSPQIPFSSMMLQLRPFLITFVIAGTSMMMGFYLIIYPLLKNKFVCYFEKL
jgi:nitric oxide reductase subunit B